MTVAKGTSAQVEQHVLDNLLEGCQIIDSEWRYVYINPALEAQIGRGREELLGRTMMECYPGIEHTQMFAELQRCMASRAHHQFENEFVHPNGARGFYELRFVPIPDGMCVFSCDITRRRLSEQSLRQSQETLAELHTALPDAVLLVAGDGKILMANRAAERFFGERRVTRVKLRDLIRSQARELDLSTLLHAKGVEVKGAEAKAAAEFKVTRSPVMHEELSWVGVREDGVEFPVSVAVEPTLTGGERAFVALVRDMTEVRSLERQLRQAQKLEALGQVASGVAHDFNNLLSVILSYSSLLLEDSALPERLRSDVNAVHVAGLKAAELTRRLLTFGRRQVLQPQVSSLNDILTHFEPVLSRILGDDVELELVLSSELGLTRLDSRQVEQVIVNLVMNARDAMPNGGKLTISTRNMDTVQLEGVSGLLTNGPHAVLTISDTGVGMDEATRSRVFEPFFSTKSRGSAAGLGLAAVFGVMKQSGGHVDVVSALGKGTTFHLFFPRCDEPHTSSPSGPSLTPISRRQGTETVLVVDDEEQVLALATKVLRRTGYEVYEAHGGGEALELCALHAGKLQLLITDIVMPKMSGPELAERVLAVCPQIKVLYMSGYPDDLMVKSGVVDPNVAFLQKPITPEAFGRKVREVLDRSA
ncbi:MAG TPA: PAS domain S-box protein [Polyangiaceae bacterium]|nr:PAS domain S-box protein [Polyangiaceae bacterium]